MLDHGGRLREAAARYAVPLGEWLDLSTGINPNGWPVDNGFAAACYRLPEEGDGLEVAAADYYGSAELLPVAGSQAAIQGVPRLRLASRVAVLAPAYAEHAHGWRRAGHAVCEVTPERLEAELDRFDVVVAVNPNNPTGERLARERLLDWRARLARRGGWLLVDEAFIDATPEASLIPYLPLPGLIVLRSLGKFFGLPGVRLGFLFAEAALRLELRDELGPWAVSGPARVIGAEALRDRVWQRQSRDQLLRAGERLRQLLERFGLAPSGTTSLFCYVERGDAEAIADALARQALLVRRFETPAALRFGLPGGEAEWRRLETALAAAVAQSSPVSAGRG